MPILCNLLPFTYPTMPRFISNFIEKCRYAHAHPVEGGYRHALKLIVPLVLGNSAFTIMQFSDRILLSRHSSLSIQAALPAGMLSFTLISFFSAIAGYSSTFVAQYHGAKDDVSCVRSAMSGLWLSLIFTPIFLAMIPAIDICLSIAGHPEALREQECIYAFWMLLGGFPMTVQWVFNGYLVSRNRVIANTVMTVFGCALNILLDVLLIFGYWGFPAWGLRGAAIATFASQMITMSAQGLLLVPDIRRVGFHNVIAPDWHLIWRMIRFGAPSGVQMLFDAGSYSFFTILTARLDALSLATSNIAFSINSLAISPLIGFGTAASTLVGQFQGEGNSKLAMRSGWRCMHLAWAYMFICALVFVFFPEQLLVMFRSPDAEYTVEEMLGLGRILLWMMAGWGMFDAMNAIFMGTLKGAGDTFFVMLNLTLLAWLFWIPLELLIINVFELGIVAAWFGQVAYLVILSLIHLWRWCSGRWAKIDLIEKRADAP